MKVAHAKFKGRILLNVMPCVLDTLLSPAWLGNKFKIADNYFQSNDT